MSKGNVFTLYCKQVTVNKKLGIREHTQEIIKVTRFTEKINTYSAFNRIKGPRTAQKIWATKIPMQSLVISSSINYSTINGQCRNVLDMHISRSIDVVGIESNRI